MKKICFSNNGKELLHKAFPRARIALPGLLYRKALERHEHASARAKMIKICFINPLLGNDEAELAYQIFSKTEMKKTCFIEHPLGQK